MTLPQRDSYAVAGAAGRAAIERALKAGAPVRALRVLLVVVAETALWSQLEAPLTHRRIAELTGMCQREITRAFAWLTEHKVLEYRPGYSLPTGPRSASIVALTVDSQDHRSTRPTVVKDPDRGRPRVTTDGPRRPPNEDPSRINRAGGGGSTAPPRPLEEQRRELLRRAELVEGADREALLRDAAELEEQIPEEQQAAAG